MNVRADTVAELLEWFFENHSEQDIYAVPAALDESTSRTGAVSFTQQISGLYGIFSTVVKDAFLAVRYFVSPADYRGVPLNLLRVSVNLQYSLIGGGSNGNSLCELIFNLDGKFGPTLLEYQFHGRSPVIVDKLFNMPTFEDILKDPATVPVPEGVPGQYAMISALVHQTTDANATQMVEYVERFSNELRVMYFRNLLMTNSTLVNNPAVKASLDKMKDWILP